MDSSLGGQGGLAIPNIDGQFIGMSGRLAILYIDGQVSGHLVYVREDGGGEWDSTPHLPFTLFVLNSRCWRLSRPHLYFTLCVLNSRCQRQAQLTWTTFYYLFNYEMYDLQVARVGFPSTTLYASTLVYRLWRSSSLWCLVAGTTNVRLVTPLSMTATQRLDLSLTKQLLLVLCVHVLTKSTAATKTACSYLSCKKKKNIWNQVRVLWGGRGERMIKIPKDSHKRPSGN